MARNRLTEEEFDEVFTDHLTRNPMVRSSFTKLPVEVREKLKDEWYEVWRTVDLEDLQAASRLFLRDPNHALAPGRDLNKHCGSVFKVANELARSRRSGESSSGSEWDPGDGSTRLGCPICKGDNDRRIPVWPFGVYKEWAIELRGEDHWKAVRAVMLICPCNTYLINALEERHGLGVNEDRFPRQRPRECDWPGNIPTIYNEDRHDRYDFPTYFLAICAYERDVLKLGKKRGRYGPNPISGDSMMDDIVDAVWGDDPLRPVPKSMTALGPKFKKPRTDRPIYTRPRAEPVGSALANVSREVSPRKDRQLPPSDRDDHEEGSLGDAREARPKIVGHETFRIHAGLGPDEEPVLPPTTENDPYMGDELVDFPGTDEDAEKFSGMPSKSDEPNEISREERRRRRRAALGKE